MNMSKGLLSLLMMDGSLSEGQESCKKLWHLHVLGKNTCYLFVYLFVYLFTLMLSVPLSTYCNIVSQSTYGCVNFNLPFFFKLVLNLFFN
jgi:hypothetical protein